MTEPTTPTITTESAFDKIAELIGSFYYSNGERISTVISEMFANKLGKSVRVDKLIEVTVRANILVGYSAKNNVWILVVYNRVCRGCRGYMFNPDRSDEMTSIPECSLSFRSAICAVESYKLKYRIFSREEAGTSILQKILGGYVDMGG